MPKIWWLGIWWGSVNVSFLLTFFEAKTVRFWVLISFFLYSFDHHRQTSSFCSYFIFPTLCCFPLGRKGVFSPPGWKRNQAILLRRISGGRITATGRKTNGMKYATKAADGFLLGRLGSDEESRDPDQNLVVGWVCYLGGWNPTQRFLDSFRSHQRRIPINQLLTWNVTKVFIAGQIRHLWQLLRQTWCLHVAVVIGRLISPHLFWRLRYCYCLPGV